MSRKFGWCLDRHHTNCRHWYTSDNGPVYCSCECHTTNTDEQPEQED